MSARESLFLLTLSLSLVSPVFAADDEESASATEQESQEEEESEEKPDTGGKFLPVPFFITEPAIGEGLGAALVYFHADDAEAPRLASATTLNRADRAQTPPPTATGVFAAYTNNDTHAYGAGHARTFMDDTYRLTALAAKANVNATYYVADFPFDFSLDGTVIFARLKRRFGDSNMFIGAATSYLDGEVDFPISPGPEDMSVPGIPEVPFRDIGISASFIYDSRDDTMMPTTGQLAELSVWKHDEALGGDYDYTSATLKVNSFHALGKKWVLGLRLETSAADGDVPFYAAPYVKLRGIPALRYQGKVAGAVEVELRYKIAKRWAVLGFFGEGFTDERGIADETDDEIKAYGVGFRWLALQSKNVWVGIDAARGPEQDAFYIQLVHPW
ncbi:MAG: BamA/TamA family outer membrane protein [Woeseiaceae bacterium]